MKIYLVRHGEAVPPEINPGKPLSPQGREDVEKVARFLGKKSFPLNLILHSSKARARETAAVMQEYIAPEAKLEEHPQVGPEDPIESGFVRLGAEGGDCMIVGHLPYLSKMLGHAVAGNELMNLVNFQPATTVCIESSNGGWLMNWVVALECI